MIYSHIKFSDNEGSRLETYIHDAHDELNIGKRKAIIVCPGGGYEFLSEREAEPIALQYFAAGLNAFVLRYPIGKEAADYAPLIEACLAIKYLREHCEELYVDPDFVYITGFSAGGHLAASAGTLWHIPEVQKMIGNAAPEICKPTATILCYPVITNDSQYRHKGSILALNGYKDDGDMDRFSLETFVDDKTVPAFLWHTAKDTCVPVQNSLLYATALAKKKIPFELHIHPMGDHGLALCNEETVSNNPSGFILPYNEDWIKYALKWVKEAPFKKK